MAAMKLTHEETYFDGENPHLEHLESASCQIWRQVDTRVSGNEEHLDRDVPMFFFFSPRLLLTPDKTADRAGECVEGTTRSSCRRNEESAFYDRSKCIRIRTYHEVK